MTSEGSGSAVADQGGSLRPCGKRKRDVSKSTEARLSKLSASLRKRKAKVKGKDGSSSSSSRGGRKTKGAKGGGRVDIYQPRRIYYVPGGENAWFKRLFDPKASPKALLRQNIRCANAALLYYNQHNSSDFELVEIIDGGAYVTRLMWFHVSFKAKPKTAAFTAATDTADADTDSLDTKFFFAEMYGAWKRTPYNNYQITVCCIVDPTDPGYNDVTCRCCHDTSIHPPGFQAFMPRPGYPELERYLTGHREENRVKGQLRRNIDRANAALLYYNQHNSSDFELVEIIQGGELMTRFLWYHVSFKAKPKATATAADASDLKFFFAEMYAAWYTPTPYNNCQVTVCCIVDPPDSGICDVTCRGCHDTSFHPPGFQAFMLRPGYPELERYLPK